MDKLTKNTKLLNKYLKEEYIVIMETKKIREDYVFPIHLKYVDTIHGIKLYSSEALKKKFVEIISGAFKDSEISKKISDLVSQDKLVPCFVISGMFKMLVSKITGKKKNEIAGTYHAEKDKTFVLIDMAQYKMFAPSNDELIRTTIHELVHMSFRNNWKKLFPLFIDEVVKFFLVFYKDYFDVDMKKDRMKGFVEGQIKNSYRDYNLVYATVFGEGLDPEKVEAYFDLVGRALTYQSYTLLYKEYRHIMHSLLYAYGEAFDLPSGTIIPLSFQELWHPDEIICIASAFLYKSDSRFKKVILMI